MKSKIIGLVVCMLLFTTTLSVAVPLRTQPTSDRSTTLISDDWPMFGHDAARTSFSTSTGPTKFLVWNKAIGPGSISSPVVVNNFVYFLTNDMKLHALSASNGIEQWNYSNAGTPVFANDLIYFDSGAFIYCLYTNGTLKMKSNSLGATIRTPLAYANGFIYASTNNKKVQCLYSDNLTLQWSVLTGTGNPSYPTFANDCVYVGTLEPRVYCLYATNGSVRWSRIVGSPLVGSYGFAPTVIGDLLYVGAKTSGYRIYCLDANTGNQIWVTDISGGVSRIPLSVAYDKIFFGYLNSNDVTSRILCLNSQNGSQVWEYTIAEESNNIASPVEIAGGLVYIGTPGNKVICLDSLGNGDGTTNMVWSSDVGASISSSQAIVDGFLYVTTNNVSGGSDIFCFGGNNYPPLKPTVQGPSDGLVGKTYTFTAVTTDPDNDQISYDFNWGDGHHDVSVFTNSGTPASMSHIWTIKGSYEIKVTVKDIYGQPNQSDAKPIVIKAPALAIGNITGGFVNIAAEIMNTGDGLATNVSWNITLTGGAFIIKGEKADGLLPSLDAVTTYVGLDKPVLGFGKATITVTASADGVDEITKTAEVFIFIFFVFGIK
jgi:outer membrane protein assembly factor BamB